MYQIETGIPLPEYGSWSKKYPWSQLNVDQSFFVPDGNLESIRASASQQKAKWQRRYVVRAVDGGVRVWRVE